jgi:hypothetical protein
MRWRNRKCDQVRIGSVAAAPDSSHDASLVQRSVWLLSIEPPIYGAGRRRKQGARAFPPFCPDYARVRGFYTDEGWRCCATGVVTFATISEGASPM